MCEEVWTYDSTYVKVYLSLSLLDSLLRVCCMIRKILAVLSGNRIASEMNEKTLSVKSSVHAREL